MARPLWLTILLRSLLSLHLFVATVLIETVTHSFYTGPNHVAFRPHFLTAAANIALIDQWFKYSINGLNILNNFSLFSLFSSYWSNNENVEIFSHVQYFTGKSNRFSISFCGHYN